MNIASIHKRCIVLNLKNDIRLLVDYFHQLHHQEITYLRGLEWIGQKLYPDVRKNISNVSVIDIK